MQNEVSAFLNYLSVEKGFSPNTRQAYQNDLHQLTEFVQAKAGQQGFLPEWWAIDRPLILDYVVSLKERGYAPSTVARKVAATRSFLKFLAEEGLLEKDPAKDLGSPRVGRSLPKAVSVADIEALLLETTHHTGPEGLRDRAMMELLYASGMRVSELMSLNLDDVNSKCVRCLGKGSKERLIPIHDKAAQAVEEYLARARSQLLRDPENKALFLNRRGQRLTRQGFWLILKGYAKEAQIQAPITPHVFRHSIATHLLHSGKMNLRELQEFLGHANIATTQVYTHLTDEHVRRVYDKAHPRAR